MAEIFIQDYNGITGNNNHMVYSVFKKIKLLDKIMEKENNKIRINEKQLIGLIKETLEEFVKPDDWNDTEFNGVYTDQDGSVYMPDDDVPEPEVDDEDLLAHAEEVDGNPDLMMGRLYGLSENKLVGLIKESIKEVLNESTIYGYTSYCPAERELGVEWDDSADKELSDLMWADYKITFTGNAWRDRGDYYQPPEEGIDYVRLSDDDGIESAIAQIKQRNPELGAAVEKDYKDFYVEAFYDAEGVYGGIVEWDWDNAGSYDYPDD